MEEEEFDKAIKNFEKVLGDLRRISSQIYKKQSYYDTMVSEYYHLFEKGKFPPNIRKKIDNGFDECLNGRRIVKMQLSKIQSIEMGLKSKGINLTIPNECGIGEFKPIILTKEFKEYEKYLQR